MATAVQNQAFARRLLRFSLVALALIGAGVIGAFWNPAGVWPQLALCAGLSTLVMGFMRRPDEMRPVG